jgi:hypothetical protein
MRTRTPSPWGMSAKRVSIIPLLSFHTVLGVAIIEETTDGDTLLEFIGNVVVRYCPVMLAVHLATVLCAVANQTVRHVCSCSAHEHSVKVTIWLCCRHHT